MTIVSGDGQGVAGLSMVERYPGPTFVKNVKIEGFDYGIDLAQKITAVTFEHITLNGFRAAGIRNHDLLVAIRHLTTHGNGPAIVNNGSRGMITLLDSHFIGDGNTPNAIENASFM